jgi:hypothetical protein
MADYAIETRKRFQMTIDDVREHGWCCALTKMVHFVDLIKECVRVGHIILDG